MKNRNLSAPILSAILLSLVAGTSFFCKADPAVSNPTSSVPAAPTPKHTTAYTVVKGDSLTSIAKKFNTTRKKLRQLNNLAADIVKVKPGQVLLVPSSRSARMAIAALTAQAKPDYEYVRAQPVQDFDIPASTFASRPVPIPSQDEDADSPAPIAKPASPAGLSSAQGEESTAPVAPAPQVADTEVTPDISTKHFAPAEGSKPAHGSKADGGSAEGGLAESSKANSFPPPFNPPASRPTSRSLNQDSGSNPLFSTPANDWANRFLLQARELGDEGIEYDENWRPPGESHAWEMDCSNTARYLYKVTTGIELPRTASDQYYYLHLQGKAWDVPQNAHGLADTDFLRQNLKPGDLLFWENTYRPERQPPITHVMVFLGTNDKGQWIMAGSQTSRGGEHNRRKGGPDIYVFRPSQPCGGYTTWLGLVHHQGRFCAFGRPLEADPAKLAVVEND